MLMTANVDAIVIGAGPNGLAAAITLAEAGKRVVVFEANATAGGGVRSLELTEPGFVHDFGAAVFPLGLGSPFFRRLPLERYGLRWIHPEVPLAHPLDGGRAVLLHRSIEETAAGLGRDGAAYRRLFGPLAEAWPKIAGEVLQPMVHVPRYPIALANFGLRAILPIRALADLAFRDEPARALWAGTAAHAALPFSAPGGSAFGLVLTALAHRVGWPIPQGGAQAITDALVAHFEALGGEVVTGERVDDLSGLPAARAVLADVSPGALLRLAGDLLPSGYRKALERWRRGPAAFKLDYALDEPIPWANPDCARAATVHLGGTFEEIEASERAVAEGRVPASPYVLLAQPSLFDPARAPEGKHTAWAYGHVPLGSTVDVAEAIEAQIERFAPGFRDLILARHTTSAAELEAYNANYVGGDIGAGSNEGLRLLMRPMLSRSPGSGLPSAG